jgi:hypothetical protein
MATVTKNGAEIAETLSGILDELGGKDVSMERMQIIKEKNNTLGKMFKYAGLQINYRVHLKEGGKKIRFLEEGGN